MGALSRAVCFPWCQGEPGSRALGSELCLAGETKGFFFFFEEEPTRGHDSWEPSILSPNSASIP